MEMTQMEMKKYTVLNSLGILEVEGTYKDVTEHMKSVLEHRYLEEIQEGIFKKDYSRIVSNSNKLSMVSMLSILELSSALSWSYSTESALSWS